MLRWPRADPDLTWPDGTHRRFNPRLRCRRKRHRFGVVGVYRQRRRHPGICEQIGDHSPLGHTLVPVQCVRGNLADLPHFFELRLFVRPASLALHVYVDVHGFSLRSGRNRETIKSSVRIQKLFWSLRPRKCVPRIESPMIGQMDAKPAPALKCSRRDQEAANFAAARKFRVK
jgi:hypothetical protein